MKALVTGGGGIVGANLVRELLRDGWEVRALVRPGRTYRALAGLAVDVVAGDVLNPASLRTAAAEVDVIFHAAARFAYWGVTPDELETVAVAGTRNVIDAAAVTHVRRVVLTSSSVIFGSAPGPVVRDETASFTQEDASPYAVSKLQQARAATKHALERKVDIVSVCPTLAVGSFDFGLSTSNAIITKYLNDPFRTTFAGGCNVVSARDVARAHVLVATLGESHQPYLAGSQNLSWRDLHTTVSRVCGTPGPLTTASHTAAYLTAAWCEAVASLTSTSPSLTRAESRMVGRYYWYDDAKVRALGYSPTSTADAIADAVQWLLRTEHLSPLVRSGIHLDRFAPLEPGLTS